LKIKGFNSFLEEQVIDFAKLTDKGVFGIFGPTGSGKSSVIDAMTLALYGSVARYEADERRGFINVNTNSAAVVFEFSITLDKTVLYEVSREIKKNKNGNITHNARLIKKVDGNIEIISEKAKGVSEEIVKIIGLDYKDFIRSVVLPQGKFSEFLMLKNMERRNMLERIFGLEEYGTLLNFAVNEKKKSQTKTVDDIKSKLEVFGDISEKVLTDYENSLREKKFLLEKYRKEFEEKNKIFEKFKNYIDLKKEFDIFTLKEIELKSQKADIELKKDKADKGRRAEKVYRFIADYKKADKEYYDALSVFKNLKRDYDIIEKEFSVIKKEYDDFIEEKKKIYPLVIKKETELKRGEEINKYIETVKEEREKFLKDYKDIKNILLKKMVSFENEEKLKKDIELKILNIEEEKEKHFVSPEYRKDIEEAANIEKKFFELKNKYNLETENKNNFLKIIRTEENKVAEIEKRLSEVSEKNENLKNERSLCEKNNNFSFSEIVDLQKKTEKAKTVFTNKKEQYKKYISQKKEFDLNILQKEKLSKKLDEIIEKETEKAKSIMELDEKIKLLENKEFILELALNLKENSPCPICGSIHHPMPAKDISDGILNKSIEEKKELQKEMDGFLQAKNDINSKNAVCTSKIIKFNEEYGEINDDIKLFDVEKEEALLNEKIEVFEKTKTAFEKYQDKIKELDKAEKNTNSELNLLKIKLAELKSELKKDFENLENSERIIKEFSEEKIKIEKKYNELKKCFDIEDFQKEYLKIIDFEKIKNRLEKEEKQNHGILREKQKITEKLNIEISDYEKKLESIKISGKEKKAVIEKNVNELETICEGKNLFEYIKEIFQKKNFYDEKEFLLKNKIEDIELQKNTVFENKIKSEKEKDALNKTKKSIYDNLEKSVSENGFADMLEAENAYLPNEDIEHIEKEINDYNNNVNAVLVNLKSISEKLNKCDISCSENDVDILKADIMALNESIEKALGEEGQLNGKINDIKKNLEKVNELNKEAEIQTHKLDLIIDLANTIKGNKFVEFISRRQLYYITRDASERLKRMTGGRYAIELDGDGGDLKNSETTNFVIRDDFNGGARRPSQSLSGGEVFLTSLNLALALFGKIQLKNNTSIETFFLDEGFGTLDSSVLDTVMDSLEKLTLEKMNVGIITHVEEVKNRIQSKIIVEPSDGAEGTKIINAD